MARPALARTTTSITTAPSSSIRTATTSKPSATCLTAEARHDFDVIGLREHVERRHGGEP